MAVPETDLKELVRQIAPVARAHTTAHTPMPRASEVTLSEVREQLTAMERQHTLAARDLADVRVHALCVWTVSACMFIPGYEELREFSM